MGVLPPDLMIDARTAVRIVCGLFFLPHTIAKLRDIERAAGFFNKAGLRPPRFFVVLTALLEVIAAFGLISGLYPRIGATIAAGILLVAAYAIGRVHDTQVALAAPRHRIHAVLGDHLPVRGVSARDSAIGGRVSCPARAARRRPRRYGITLADKI